MPEMRTSAVLRSWPKYRPVTIRTSPGFATDGVIESSCGGRPVSRELRRTTMISPTTTAVGMKPLLRKMRWWTFAGAPPCGSDAAPCSGPPVCPSPGAAGSPSASGVFTGDANAGPTACSGPPPGRGRP